MRLLRGIFFTFGIAVLAIVALSGPVSAELDDTPDDTWQVVGHIPDSVGLTTLVWDFAELDGVMYVGGSFSGVRRGSGSPVQPQAHLAAFDVDTGVWIDSFRPDLDGAVFSIEPSADGSHLIIGGEFAGGIRAIDPITGTKRPGWNTDAVHDQGRAVVMDVEPDGAGGWYFGGYFTHVNDGGADQRRYRLARIDGAGNLDPTWRPIAQGGRVYTIAASPVADWVHIGGKFTNLNVMEATGFFATAHATTGATIESVPHGYPEGAISSVGVLPQKIYGIVATTDMLWVGGEPHVLIALDPLTLETQKFSFTNRGLGDRLGGGDVQAVYATEDRVYAGCHCWGSVDTYDPLGPDEWPGYRAWVSWFATETHDDVRAVFAFDKATMSHSKTFVPDLTGREGVWAITEDSNGRMWFGGEFSSAAGRFPGGFVRYSDAGAPTPRIVVDEGSTWTYRNASTTPPAAWISTGFDDAGWQSGDAQLGFGDGDEATTIDAATWGRSAYFRQEFDVINAETATGLALEIVADDGYVAYLNGEEIARANVPEGPLTASTLALEARWGRAETTPERIVLPPSALRNGANTLAVEVHNIGSSGDLSFAASLQGAGPSELTEAAPEGPLPEPPSFLISDFTDDERVVLRWAHNDTSEISAFWIFRDDVYVATTSARAYTDRAVNPGETHTYEIVAVDTDGLKSERSNPVTMTVGQNSYTRRRSLRPRAWDYVTTDPGTGWTESAFDDGQWLAGTDRVGFNRANIETDIGPTEHVWLRSTVTIAAANATPDALMLLLQAEDAGVVYINGHEVWRRNFEDGAIEGASQPTRPIWSGVDKATLYALVPGDLIVEGENTFAMKVSKAALSDDLIGRLFVYGLSYDPATAPTAPGALAATETAAGVQLSWQAASDDVGLASYGIYRNGEIVGSSMTTTFFAPAVDGTSVYTVRALDTFGNTGPDSNPVTVTNEAATLACTVVNQADGSVLVSWDAIEAKGYDVSHDGGRISWTKGTTFIDLTPGTTYRVIAWQGGAAVDMASCDNPNPGGGVDWTCAVTVNGDGSATISWANIGANGYDVIRDGGPKKWVRQTSHIDPTPGTSYEIVAWGGGVSGTSTTCSAGLL